MKKKTKEFAKQNEKKLPHIYTRFSKTSESATWHPFWQCFFVAKF
jgi:hypothetical protein